VDPQPDEPTDDERAEDESPDTADAASDDEPTAGTTHDDDGTSRSRGSNFDLKSVLRQLTTPMVESLDARLRDQVEAHVDELLVEKVDAAVRDRLSILDRAIADLSRSLEELERRISELGRPHEEG
jgi:hypothetical protein